MKNTDNKKGFSLIELVISVSIISLLATIFLANYHNINQRTDLAMTAQTLVSDIRFAQSNALGLIKYGEEIPGGGWGIFISANPEDRQYIIFADTDSNREVSFNEDELSFGARTVVLPEKISIDEIYLDSGTVVSDVNIVFLPPDPVTYIITQFGDTSAINIRLKESINNTTKTVRVNFLGLVEVID
ncbi:prepilin-type N-terminal cleavage/methylation domain-containing protein [Patescibacteria group bacterium]|nr:prepilin-type N-terminal cleavage/methylation domain-containing protein [Patescibacteria group bacterium]